LRIYDAHNTEVPERPNRISVYAFNSAGGEGSGAYVQNKVRVNQWIMIDMIINTTVRNAQFPTGYIRIYRNGVRRQTVPLDQFNVTPRHGPSPLLIGTSRRDSFFKGAIGPVAVFDYALSAKKIARMYAAMTLPPRTS
jgi:hypothetical protein